jgi:GNAT superfamily N-acetyltransferase
MGCMVDEDPLIRWAVSARGARIFRGPGAVAVGCAQLSHWDRLVVDGDAPAVADLVRVALPELGRSFRPFGAEELIADVVARVPELELSARFAWMEITEPVQRARGEIIEPVQRARRELSEPVQRPRDEIAEPVQRPGGELSGPVQRAGGGTEAGWLAEQDWPEVTALIEESFPDSYARPGDPDVRRWAGVRDHDGRLLAIAAEAWSTDEIGFMAGVTTHPDARGRGLGATLCGFVADELLAGRERVALIVDYWNTAAIATYRRLGFTTRPVAAARQR